MMIARYIAVNDVTESNPLESEVFVSLSLSHSSHLEQQNRIDTNFYPIGNYNHHPNRFIVVS